MAGKNRRKALAAAKAEVVLTPEHDALALNDQYREIVHQLLCQFASITTIAKAIRKHAAEKGAAELQLRQITSLVAAVRKEIQVSFEEQRATLRAQQVAAIEYSLVQVNTDINEERRRGNGADKAHVRGLMRLRLEHIDKLADISGTKVLQVDVVHNVQIQQVLQAAIGELTPEQQQELIDEQRTLERQAAAFRRLGGKTIDTEGEEVAAE